MSFLVSEKRNIKIRNELNEILEKTLDSENILVLGDFNGHIGYIGPQDLNRNGRYVLELIEKYNLILLNGDDRCQGEITREENGVGSVIDFALCNKNLYNIYKNMEIDEDKSLFSLSDHCLIEINFLLKEQHVKKFKKSEIVEYYDTRNVLKDEFMSEFLNSTWDNIDMKVYDDNLNKCADRVLKKKYSRRLKENNKPQAKWFTKEMKESINKRKHYNRLARNASTENEKSKYKELYTRQKFEASSMIREGIRKYEYDITKKIREQDNIKDMWKNINKLRRREENKRDVILYNEQGNIVKPPEIKKCICDFWKGIYQSRNNEIHLAWNDEEKAKYIQQLEKLKIKFKFDKNVTVEEIDQFRALRCTGPRLEAVTLVDRDHYVEAPVILREHLDMVGRVNADDCIGRMRLVEFSQAEVKEQMSKIKKGRQPGPDKLKPEIYKWVQSSEASISILTECMNGVLRDSEIPEKWKKSKTNLIPKNCKPKKNELRPIALTNVSYKIFMGLCKKKLVEHLQDNDRISNYQSGFTIGRRLEDNILILKYCISESSKNKVPLIVTAIDFTKAFDSIDRRKLIDNLKYYKCDPLLIDIIAKLYTNDSTTLSFNGEDIGDIKVQSGIRQGCTGSPWLFVMAVNQIINKILQSKLGFKSDEHYVPVLFYADDGLILTQNFNETIKLIEILETVAGDIGLRINRKKTQIIIFNMKEKPKEIEKIEVVDEIRYLGVQISNSRDCFKQYKDQKIRLAQKMSNMTYSVIARSCNKMLIGKTYWKGVVLPSVLFASSVVNWDKTAIGKLQTNENNVWRNILGCPGYTPIAAMRGDIGASTMKIRIMKNKLKYTRYIMSKGNELLRGIFLNMYNQNRDSLIREIRGYMEELDIGSLDMLVNLNENSLLNLIRSYDSNKWLEDIRSKSTLNIYTLNKTAIKEEIMYDNSIESTLLFRCRSNTLKLNWRNRFEGGDTRCKACDSGEEETLEHFLIGCEGLSNVRGRYRVEERSIADLLRFNDVMAPEIVKNLIGELWRERKRRTR